MEFRKLISFGKTSYIISLPKTWVERNKLHKGDLIALDERTGELVITSENQQKQQESRELTLQIDNKDISEIRRSIVSAYIDGFNSITIAGKALKDRVDEIKEILQNLMALEVVEETSNKIVTKDFIDISKTNIWELVRKMDITTREMIADAKKFLQASHVSTKNIYLRDDDINRIYYLLLRIIKQAISNPAVAKSHKLSELQLLSFWEIVSYIEKISDEVKRIAKYLERADLKPSEKAKFENIYSKAEDFYLKMMKGFFLKNRDLVLNLANKKEELITETNALLKEAQRTPWLPSAIEKTKSMIITINDIGRTLSQISTLE